MALRSPLLSWPVWQLPRWLAACLTAVIAAYAAGAVGALASTPVRPGDLRLCAVFVGCGAASVELTRRAGEREGLTRDVFAIWDLPAAVLLPPLYALVIPSPVRSSPSGASAAPCCTAGPTPPRLTAWPTRRPQWSSGPLCPPFAAVAGDRAAMPRPGSRSLPGAGC
jgi:hypothetical protein